MEIRNQQSNVVFQASQGKLMEVHMVIYIKINLPQNNLLLFLL